VDSVLIHPDSSVFTAESRRGRRGCRLISAAVLGHDDQVSDILETLVLICAEI